MRNCEKPVEKLLIRTLYDLCQDTNCSSWVPDWEGYVYHALLEWRVGQPAWVPGLLEPQQLDAEQMELLDWLHHEAQGWGMPWWKGREPQDQFIPQAEWEVRYAEGRANGAYCL